MARAGRSYPNRPVLARHPRNWDRPVTLGAFETVSEWPAISVETPNADLVLGPFETVSEWPALTLANDYNLVLGAFETLSEWPSLDVSVPVLPGDSMTGEAGQVEWNGTLWGAGTGIRVQEITGWRSLPQLDNLNVERPSRHGAWPARRLAQQRVVTMKLQPNSIGDEDQIDAMLGQIDAVTGVLEDETEWPLVIKGYGDAQLAFGAIMDRDVAMDGLYSVGAPTVSVMVVCSDPRRYSLVRTGVNLPADETVEAANAGNTATNPILRITGPATDPTITNVTLDRTVQFALTLGDGEQLVIDTDAGTAVIGSDSQMQHLTGISVPVTEFVLTRGVNRLRYSPGSGGAAPVVCLYRDSWL